MTMLRTCGADGCTTKTLGELCLDHEGVRIPDRRPSFEFKRAQARGRLRPLPEPAKLAPAGERGR
jgi:hypothetical protein